MQDKHHLPGGLYALVDDGVRGDLPVPDKARAVLEGGARVLQLRLKRTGDRPALAAIREVVEAAHARGALVIVDDRADLALAGGADGVHLGDDDLPPDVARSLLGPDAYIGVTTRSLEEIVRARSLGADHVGLGPIFPTATKAVDHPALGVAGFQRIARQSPLPVVAIAGITLETIGEVARAGARCAAVASDLFTTGDPITRARALQQAFFGQT